MKIVILNSQGDIGLKVKDGTVGVLNHQKFLIYSPRDRNPRVHSSLEISELPSLLFSGVTNIQFSSGAHDFEWYIPEVGTRLAEVLSQGWNPVVHEQAHPDPNSIISKSDSRVISYFLVTGLISATALFRVVSTDESDTSPELQPGQMMTAVKLIGDRLEDKLSFPMIYLGGNYFLFQMEGLKKFVIVTRAAMEKFLSQVFNGRYQFNRILLIKPECCIQQSDPYKHKLSAIDHIYKAREDLKKLFSQDPVVSRYFNDPSAWGSPSASYLK